MRPTEAISGVKIAHEPSFFKQTGLQKAFEMANKITLNQGLVKRSCGKPIAAPVTAVSGFAGSGDAARGGFQVDLAFLQQPRPQTSCGAKKNIQPRLARSQTFGLFRPT